MTFFFLEIASPSEIERPVFEQEPIISPKIWLHEMRPSTVPVFAFVKAGHSNGGGDRGSAFGGGDLKKKKKVTLAYPRDVQPPYLVIIAVCNKRPGFAFRKNGHSKQGSTWNSLLQDRYAGHRL